MTKSYIQPTITTVKLCIEESVLLNQSIGIRPNTEKPGSGAWSQEMEIQDYDQTETDFWK